MGFESSRASRDDLTADRLEVLLRHLASDPAEAADRYKRLFTRVQRYLAWERCADPDRWADDVIDRVARRLAEGQAVANLPAYVLGVARRVAHEARDQRLREERAIGELARIAPVPAIESESALACLDRCLARLSANRRYQLLAYYSADPAARIGERKRLATLLGVGPVALRNRMLRLRARLEACVNRCLAQQGGRDVSGDEPTTDSASGGPQSDVSS